MSMDFIRLHRQKTNKAIIISVADIVYVDTSDDVKKNALIFLKDGRIQPFYVNETPDKIHKFLNEHFVRLHKSKDNMTIIVNVGEIVYVGPAKDEKKGTGVIIRDTRVAPLYVNEAPDKFCKLLNVKL